MTLDEFWGWQGRQDIRYELEYTKPATLDRAGRSSAMT